MTSNEVEPLWCNIITLDNGKRRWGGGVGLGRWQRARTVKSRGTWRNESGTRVLQITLAEQNYFTIPWSSELRAILTALAVENKTAILLKRQRQTGTVADLVAWPNPSISGAHAYIKRSSVGWLTSTWFACSVSSRHKKPQRRVCIDSIVLSTTVASPLHELLAGANSPAPIIVRRGFAL